MTKEQLTDEYFAWLYDLVCKNRFAKEISYEKLLRYLFNTEFYYVIEADSNRASDGVNLRSRYSQSIDVAMLGQCNVLEMMVSLAVRCEENIMDDPSIGDRTGQWFWGMIVSLGLGSMTDDKFDEEFIARIISNFLNRTYEPDGQGGLFTIKRCECDLRKVEIWRQLCWYLNTIT